MYYQNTNFAAIVPASVKEIIRTDKAFRNPKIFENAMLFITHLKLQNQIYKDSEQFNPAIGYHSDLLRAIFSSDYFEKLVKILIDLGIVEKSGNYSPGIKSFQFKLNDRFFFEKSEVHKYTYNGVVKKINNIKSKFYQNRYLKRFPYLLNQYNNLQSIFIDSVEAMNWIDCQEPKWIEQEEKVQDIKKRNDIQRRVMYYKNAVNKIEYAFTQNVSVSLSNLRLNSALTAFPKNLRPYLYIQDAVDGVKLFKKIEIDGSNTQPLMLSIYLEKMKYQIEPEFKELCLSGMLYNSIAEALNESREWVKERMMDTLMFTRTNGSYTFKYKNPDKVHQEIRTFSKYCSEVYPKFFKALITEKQKLEKFETHPENWINPGGSELAKRIQKMESELWIHTLLKELPENLFYVTIHDSIMIFDPTVEDVLKTRNKILDIGYKLHGILLPLKLEFHNIIGDEKQEYQEAFNSNAYVPEQSINISENFRNTTCIDRFKIDDSISQDERIKPIETVSSDMFEKLFRNKREELYSV